MNNNARKKESALNENIGLTCTWFEIASTKEPGINDCGVAICGEPRHSTKCLLIYRNKTKHQRPYM